MYSLSKSLKQYPFIFFNSYFIIFHFRCSVDPYLFGNFLTENGDNLKANFRAFKFPASSFVMFKGILNVCIDVCEGVSFILSHPTSNRCHRSSNTNTNTHTHT